VRVGAEQYAVGFQRAVQLQQHTWQFPARYMEQRGVGKDAVKAPLGKLLLVDGLLVRDSGLLVVGFCYWGK
jgi:hypothetical protein